LAALQGRNPKRLLAKPAADRLDRRVREPPGERRIVVTVEVTVAGADVHEAHRPGGAREHRVDLGSATACTKSERKEATFPTARSR